MSFRHAPDVHDTENDESVAAPDSDRLKISVFILYEDVACGKRAKQVYDTLVSRLSEVGIFDYQLWKFGILAHEELRDLAASEAAGSDIVFIAARGDGDLPESVKSWLESWADGHHKSGALVALFNQPDAVENISKYLRDLADRGRLDFFAPVKSSQRFPLPDIALQPHRV